jgi:hypothetical protein
MRLPKRPTRSQLVAVVLAAIYALANVAVVLADGNGGTFPR